MTVQRANELYQTIGEQATSQIAEPWSKLEIRAEIDDEISLFDAWYLSAGNEKKMLEVSFELSTSFENLRNLESMSKNGKWSICTFSLGNDGKLETDFSYDEQPRWVE